MGSPWRREFGARPSQGRSEMKGRGLVLHEPTWPWPVLSLTTAGRRDRAGGLRQEPAGIRSPRDLPAERCCCGASPLRNQGTCSGPAAGSVGIEPRLGALLPLMVSAGHTDTCGDTNTDKCHVQTWTHLCLRAQLGLRPRVWSGTSAAISQPRDPRCPKPQLTKTPQLPGPISAHAL